ncbi:DEKNAAC100466 [Brettanomyces naardenensis]|uniref:DEKNAAC100466 n=1 Tax=Brettanomyces naardenensis TaxID=13370 RepID=A0A448YFI6_BRENA|nr:DEKNAAC100466 [Brettanomyces naardenensis]
MARIVTVGAGVIGLTTSLVLARKGHKVTIIAQHLPGDLSDFYASPYAGAFFVHLLPISNGEWIHELQDIASYYEILEIAEKDAASGVVERETEVYIPRMSLPVEEGYDGPWFKDLVRDYSVIPPAEYPEGSTKDDIAYAFKYTGFLINPVQYLHYLLGECLRSGVQVQRKTVETLTEAKTLFIEPTGSSKRGPTFGANPVLSKNGAVFGTADIVINCAGIAGSDLNTKDLGNKLPIKGQTLLVENNAEKIIVVEPMDQAHPTESLYILPRKGYGTLLTGTYLYGDNSLNFDPALTERIKARALRYAPELVNPSFMKNPPKLVEVKQFIGIRPGRKGGFNVSRDRIQGVDIIQNYGSGANGYQNSFGLAHKVSLLVDDVIFEKGGLTSKL